AAGNVYVIQSFSADSLYKFAPNGTFLGSVSLGTSDATDISINEAGNLLYVAAGTSSPGIKIYDIAGALPTLVGSIATPAGASILGIHFASESGNVLATDWGNLSNDPRGLEYSPAGTLLREYRPASAVRAWDITSFPVAEPTS